MDYRCLRPPPGWKCSRIPGHIGPCAARPNWWNVRGVVWQSLSGITDQQLAIAAMVMGAVALVCGVVSLAIWLAEL